MKITRDVITDLLPAYEDHEASADTRALVEEFLAQDPAFARDLDASRRQDFSRQPPATGLPMTVSPDHAQRTLAQTKAMIARRTWLFAIALTCTLVPLSLSFDAGHITWMMVRDVPRVAALYWTAGALCWGALALTNRRLRTTGL
jgi:anti-sigma factor RsiW